VKTLVQPVRALCVLASLATALHAAAPAAAEAPTLTRLATLDVDIFSGGDSVVIGSTIYFAADDGTHGQELWKSDGTPGGTAMVANLNPDPGEGSFPRELTVLGSTLYFAARDGTTGTELWKTDGSTVSMVKDIHVGVDSSTPRRFATMGSTLFFAADDASRGAGLWRTDGTEAGTAAIDFPGLQADAENLTAVGSTLFFAATVGTTTGQELWKYSSEAGTAMVSDINAGTGDAFPEHFAVVGSTLLFRATDGAAHGYELWKSDGTPSGTAMVSDINDGAADSFPYELTAMGPIVFFGAIDGSHGYELWKSDGTAAGTAMVSDIADPGTGNPGALTVVGSRLFLVAQATPGDEALWTSDGTAAGTVPVKDIRPGGTDGVGNLTAVGSTLYFSADDGAHGTEPWSSDGTAAGTALVSDIVPGSAGSAPTMVGPGPAGSLFFAASDGTRTQLWRYALPPASPEPGPTPGGAPTPATTTTTTTTTTPVTPPPPAVAPAEVRQATAAAVSGTVLVVYPDGRTATLSPGDALPEGAKVDATKGSVTLTILDDSGTTQTVTVSGGVFVLKRVSRQRPSGLRAVRTVESTRLVLSGGRGSCRDGKGNLRRSLRVSARGSGLLQVVGRKARAIGHSAVWTTTDTCTATAIKVKAGKVRATTSAGRHVRIVTGRHSYRAPMRNRLAG
jgi:ELWxxDGT repeat protein